MVVLCTTFAAIALEGGTVCEGLGQDSIFGWLSRKWIMFFLFFGVCVGVVCRAGYNYAVSVQIALLVGFDAALLLFSLLSLCCLFTSLFFSYSICRWHICLH